MFLRRRPVAIVSMLVLGAVLAVPEGGRCEPAGVVSFTEISAETGITNIWNGLEFGAGLATEDFDNDGDTDVLLLDTVGRPNRLFENRGNAEGTGIPTFVEITAAAGLGDHGNSKGVVFADYDNDGLTDLFISNFDERVINRPKSPNYVSSITLYRNNGDRTFTDITEQAGLMVTEVGAFGLSAADIDRDGWIDIFLSNRTRLGGRREGAYNNLFRNNGDGTFTDVSVSAGIADIPNYTFQSGFFDYDNDGDADFYLCTDKWGGNDLYRNNGDGTFTNVTEGSGAGVQVNGMCVAIGDYDNDLDLDAYVTNTAEGHVLMRNDGGGRFTEVADAAGVVGFRIGWGADFVDVDNDGWLDLYVVSFGNNPHNLLYMNQRNSTFNEIGIAAGCNNPADGFGFANGDLDGDGKVDLAVSNWGDPCGVFLHSGTAQAWATFKLIGTESNRDAIGARMYLHSGHQVQLREVRAGDSYLSHSRMDVHYGLGGNVPDSLRIRWPSGRRETVHGLTLNSHHRVVEGYGLQTGTMLIDHAVEHLGHDIAVRWETVQWPDDEGFRVERVEVVGGMPGNPTVLGEMSDAGRWFEYVNSTAGLAAGTYRYRVSVLGPTPALLFESDDVEHPSTPVDLQGFEIAATPEDGVQLQWRLSASAVAKLQGVRVQRAVAEVGPWQERTKQALEPRRAMQFVDREVSEAAELWYRLVFVGADGTLEASHALRAPQLAAGVARTQLQHVGVAADGRVRVEFAMARQEAASLHVYDVRGRQVRALLQGTRLAGSYSLTWDRTDDAGRSLARGLYFFQLRSPSAMDARKLVLSQR